MAAISFEPTRLSPSEVVLIAGDRFAAKGGLLDKYRLMSSDTEVSKKQLAQIIYAAAFLAAEESGQLRLEIRPKKALLGLRTVQTLFAEPEDTAPAWPVDTVEAGICLLAVRLQLQKNHNEVPDIVYTLLGADSADPFNMSIEKVKDALGRRGLLGTVEEKKLKIFTVKHYTLPQATSDQANGSAERVEQLLEACQQTRSQVWKMLLDQVASGIKRRTEQKDTSSVGDS